MKWWLRDKTLYLLPSIAMIYLSLKGRWSWLPGWTCPIRHLSGVPCPGCYLTRSVSLSLSGQLGDALEFHVLGPPAAIGLIAWAAASLRHRRLFWSRRCQRMLIMLSGFGLVIWVVRILLQYGIGIQAFPAV